MKELKGTRKKKCLRISAAALAFCLLLTYTNPLETLSIFAAGTPAQDSTLPVSDSAQPSEESEEQPVTVETTEQTVPAETAEPTVSVGIAAEQTIPVGTAVAEFTPVDLSQSDSADSAVQALLDSIASLPDSEEYLAKEPNPEAEEAYAEWMEELHQYAGEALDIQGTYEALTEEQKAQMPSETLAKLEAWAETAQQIAGNSMAMMAEDQTWNCGANGSNVTATLDDTTHKMTISGTGAMADYGSSSPWKDKYIKSVEIEHGVTSIGDYAFKGCSNLSSVTIQDGVTSIGISAFYNCNVLKDVTIPNSVTSIGRDAFYNCSYLENLTIPDSVTSIGRDAFHNCKKITNVTIPSDVTSIEDSTFSGCSGLTSVTIQSGVISIGANAFERCSKLTSVTIPGSVTSIGNNAFQDCSALNTVTFTGSNPPTLGADCFLYSACLSNKGINIPCNWTAEELTAKNWDAYINNNQVTRVHNITPVAGKAATCVEKGINAHYKCSSCGTLFTDEAGTITTTLEAVTIAKTGHTWGSYKNDSTQHWKTCTKCGATDTKTNHSWDNGEITTNPTCTAGGVKTYTCTVCGNKSKTEPVNAKGHSYKYTATSGNTITETCNNGCGHSATATLSINSSVSRIYTGSEIKPVKVEYSTGWAGSKSTPITYSNNTKAGTDTATASLKISNVTAQLKFSITKANSTVATKPTAKNLTYNGSAQTLVSAGSASGGTMNYAVSSSSTTAPTTGWITTVPQGTNAGTYYVWYKVVGDSNHENSNPQYITVNIARASINPTVKMNGWTYGGTAQSPSVTGNSGNGGVTYKYKVQGTNDNTYTNTKPTNAGTYTVEATIVATTNYNGKSVTANFEIKPKALTDNMITINPTSFTYTGGAHNPTVTVKDGTKTLVKDKDYTKSITNNINVGNATVTITGQGNYTGTASKTFTITAATLTGVSASDYSGTYDGNFHGITVSVPAEATVTYRTSSGSYSTTKPTYKKVGEYTVYYQVTKTGYETVTGSAKVKISARSISGATITLDSGTLTYNGNPQTKDVSSVKVGSLTLTDSDYSVSGNTQTNAGDNYTITITGQGNFTGSATATFTITAKSLNADMITVASGPHPYTGDEIKPTVTVTDGSALKSNDYTVSYDNNVELGTAKVIVVGKNNYKGTINKVFTITTANISSATVTLETGTLTYNGSQQTKGVTGVKIGEKALQLGKDYTVSGNVGINAETYTITITGIGNYANSTKTVTFKIEPKPLTDGMITLASGPHYYNGSGITPDVTVKDGNKLVLDRDYTVSYDKNVEVGTNTAIVKIKGKGNYAETITKYFTIEYQPLPNDKSLTDYVEITPEPKDGWYGSDITIKPKDGSGCSVGETHTATGNVTISGETTAGGDKKVIYIKDGDKIYKTEFPYKLDQSAPAVNLSGMTVENGSKVFGNLITGTTNTTIKIPASGITDTKSGIATVTYTATPKNGGVEKTGTINAEDGNYNIALSDIVTDGEFDGTIQLTVKDKTGHTTNVTLPTAGGKVIVEQHKPEVTFALQDSPQPNGNGWYNKQPKISVAVTDNKDSDGTTITSGGIAKIQWKDGESGTVNTISGLPGTTAAYNNTFEITTTDGEHTYYVKAVDNAGNVSAGTDGWQSITVKVDTVAPSFTNDPTAQSTTKDGAVIKFTPSEEVKAYWIVSDAGAPQDAQAVKDQFTENGGKPENVAKEGNGQFTLSGLTTGQKHTVYVVLEDVAGNLSEEIKSESFITRQEAPNITLGDLKADYLNETITLPTDTFGELEAFTDSSNPSGSKIKSNADSTLSVKPGTTVYIRHPEKKEDGLSTPPSDSVEIKIPNRPSDPAEKEVAVTETTVTVTDPVDGEEYVLVEKGQTPNWIDPAPNTTGQFTDLTPNKEYDLYVRKKATETTFVSNSVKTETRTYVVIHAPEITGDGKDKDGNTAPKPNLPNDNGSVTFTGTYSEEYTPVIKTTDGQSIIPGTSGTNSEMTWDEKTKQGTWEYTLDTNGATEAKITVEFRKRAITRIDVTPDTLTIFADNTANESMDTLKAYVEENSSVNAVYDNKTSGAVQAVYSTGGSFTPKGADYVYSVSANARTDSITLTVKAVSAAVTAPDKYLQSKKEGGYTAEEVQTWLPANVTVTYTGDGYTSRTESRAVAWTTSSIGSGFGNALGENTVAGTVNLPAWATGANSVSMVIEFVDKIVLNDGQIKVDLPNFSYGTHTLPNPTGSITETDENPTYTYHYSTDGGTTWVEADNLPKSDSGYIVPGKYSVKVSYKGDDYIGEKTASFTVEKNKLTIPSGTYKVVNKNYDGTMNAELKVSGQPTLTGVVEGDKVTLGGTLSAVFTEKGPKVDIPVTVTGFILEGDNAEYYELKEETLTLYATINNADGTIPGSEKEDSDRDDYDHSYTPTSGTTTALPTPELTTQSTSEPTTQLTSETTQPTPESTQPTETQATPPENSTAAETSVISEITEATEITEITESTDRPEQNTEPNNTDTQAQESAEPAQPKKEVTQTVQASVDNGKITVPEGTASTGYSAEASKTTTTIEAGNGTVTVKVVCEEEKYTAGVKDTVAVANAVLMPEQIQLVNEGENIEIRVDVKDISKAVPEKDKDVIEVGLAECRAEKPDMTLGMYVDISMFIKVGKGDWNAVTSTTDPIEVVVSVPEELQESGREFYIIRSHEGEHTLLTDMDDDLDTITVETNLFSAYAIAYEQVEVSAKCWLCHICPTFLGICYFIWLAIVLAILLVIWIIVRKNRKSKNEVEK